MTVLIKTFTVKDPGTVRDDILRTLKNGLIARGVANPQLGPGSDYYVLATAVANEFAVVAANTQIKADAQMPDTAVGSDLDRLAKQYGLARRIAGPSSGFVTITTSATTSIAFGTQLVDQNGLRYAVSLGGTYTNVYPSNVVPVTSIDTGRATNRLPNDILRWTAQPAYAAAITVVTSAGFSGGVDAELDEDLRARLLSRLQNPPSNANWNQIAAIAEASHTAVQKAFVYPAANGPSTVHVAVVGAPSLLGPNFLTLSSTSKNRDVDATILATSVVPYVQGQLPEYVESVITTVVNVPNDVSIGLSLPASPAAVPAGPGGGWIDGTPWPSISGQGAAITKADVVSVTSSTSFLVRANTTPVANVTHICFLDATNWQLYRAKVLSFTNPTGNAASITYSGGVNTLTGLTGMTASMVGYNIVISGATTVANNGTFAIASYISATSVTVTNASGATDGNNGGISWNAGGAYVITIDTPMPNLAAGDYIWPDCVNAQLYCDTILTSFGQLGPGEKTTAVGNLTRGYRHPLPVNSWPYTLGATQLKALSNSGTEVLDASWYYRLSSAAPAVPGAVASAPNIFTPRKIAFYPI